MLQWSLRARPSLKLKLLLKFNLKLTCKKKAKLRKLKILKPLMITQTLSRLKMPL